MCCHGCEAVANAIISNGMDDFYRFRTSSPEKPGPLLPEFLQQLKAYDNPEVQKHFVTDKIVQNDNQDIREVALILEGIVCAACIWLNEKQLRSLNGILSVSINYSNHRARIRWDNDRISLSEILESISRIGYLAHPFDPDRQQKQLEEERKHQIRRIGLAGVLGMQIMIFAVAMYAGGWWGMDNGFKQSFRWISLFLTIPVLLFTSNVFFKAAWRDIRNHHVGMDTPVSLGIAIAFIASSYHTIIGTGAVYFDSVVMFTFFLLTARYFELTARKRTAEATESLLNLRPSIATRLIHTDNNENSAQQESVAVSELNIGDHLLVRPGEHIPTDGTIIQGISGINEALLTGESMPVTKSVGDTTIGGSTNTENPLIIEVTKLGGDTVLSSIQRLLEQAQNNKPEIAHIADHVASWFVGIILTLATFVGIFWYFYQPEVWVAITVATLVVTCPCALSLATPAAITAASGQLARIGLLPKKVHALETLAKVTDFVFDKTGTLTEGKLQIKSIEPVDQLTREDCLQIAASLESASEHPIARCLVNASSMPSIAVARQQNTPGGGVDGYINDHHWFLGNADFILQHCPGIKSSVPEQYSKKSDTSIFLAVSTTTQTRLHCIFLLNDNIRAEAATLISQLQQAGKQVHIMSGDDSGTTTTIANTLGIRHIHANMRPQDKLQQLQQLQQQGKIVAMIGDGINDAPVLAAADLSIAMGKGSQLAVATADMVLLSNHVLHIFSGYRIARKCLNIIRQNLIWAIVYNALAIPAAAMGYVAPWLAAIGMSLSSLLVVLNALRLTRMYPSISNLHPVEHNRTKTDTTL